MVVEARTMRPKPAWQSPWVRAAAGMMLLVVSVNITFIVIANKSNPGLVTEEYIKYGLQQNTIGIQYREQKIRGWQVDMLLPKKIIQSRKYRIVVQARDASGAAINGAQAEIAGYRPSDAKEDIFFTLTEMAERPGVYIAEELALPLPGTWEMNLLLRRDGEQYISSQRINVEAIERSDKDSYAVLKWIVGMLTMGNT